MKKPPVLVDLRELAESTGVSVRTIRFYQQQGLLDSPGHRGPGALYGARDIDRLRLLRMLQREHLPLAEIRKQLDAMSDDEVARALALGEAPVQRSSAAEYARRVLAESAPRSAAERELSERGAIFNEQEPSATNSADAVARPRAGSAARRPPRESWERLTLTEDIELHIRRPLSREQNRLVEQLLATAHRHLEQEERP